MWSKHPSYCCPKCGEQIGWLGRFFNFFIPNYHRCKRKPYKPKIKIESSGASCWENMNEYFFSDEGKEYLKEMNKFFNEYKAK